MRNSADLAVSLLALLVLGACSKSGGGSGAHEAAATPEAPLSAAAINPPAGKAALQIKDAGGAVVMGDAAAGKEAFVVCQACHSLQAGANRVGPSLHGVVGRKAGSVPGFAYSPANRSSGLIWSEQQLYAYLEHPQKTVPGTYMTYTGVQDPQKRADLIAYLAAAGQ